MKYRFTLAAILSFLFSQAFGQTAEIRGSLFDAQTEEALEGAEVLIYSNEELIKATATDAVGYFEISGLQPGAYRMDMAYLTRVLRTEDIRLGTGAVLTRFKIKLRTTQGSDTLRTFTIQVRGNDTEDDGQVDVEDQEKADVEVGGLVSISPALTNEGGRIRVGPSRADGTTTFISSPAPVLGPGPTTLIGLSGVEVIDRGVPARYGNFTGGGIQYNYSEIGIKPRTSYQFQSTSPFNGYHHNLGIMYLSRALKIREHEQDGRVFKSTVLGFSLLGTYKFQADPSPSTVNPMVLSDEALAELQNNPLVSSEVVGGYVPAGAFIRESELEQRTARPNAQRHDAEGRLMFSFNPTESLKIDVINTVNYLRRRISQGNYVLMNSDENPLQKYRFVNSQLRLAHDVKSPYDSYGNLIDSTPGFLSRLSYVVDLSYQQTQSEVSNARHGNRFFDYGHVGNFQTVQLEQYNYIEDGETEFVDEFGNERTLSRYHEFSGYRDSLVGFTPGKANPTLADYTSFFYDQQRGEGSIQDLVARGGILNGQNLPLLYSLYANPGSVFGTYSKSFQNRFNISARTEFSLHPFKNHKLRHDFEVGLSFQQDASGYYSLNAANLWQLMPLLANSHLQNVDRSNPIISTDENGRFTDTISYPVYVDLDNQKDFDKNLRQKLIDMNYRDQNGDPITETSRIDINSLSPDVFDLSMFTADELLNNGNPYVAYSGYDYQGNRVRGKKGIQEFINNGKDRPIDAFAPITAAAWIQDKFVLKSMIIRAGLRFERYDANQQVLKDPFSIFPTRSAGEVDQMNGLDVDHPGNIGEDYVVYVDNADRPNEIVGYRDGSSWYDANGIELSDPSILANKSSSGRIQPYLLDPENQRLTHHSFKSFEAQNLVLPRISISFPINTTSLFFVSYDKLAQNPTSAQTYVPYTTYYYMQSNISGVLPNPELKARVKTEYNIGFKQNIGRYASVKLSASYANLVNDFNQFRMVEAYPYSYTTYTNIDFSTIKRYIAEYEYKSGRMSVNGSYALQFSDGTGSNANSAASLIQSGQPNLRSLFPLSYDNHHTLKGRVIYNFGRVSKDRRATPYSGPYLAGKPIFQNAFISATFQSISGRPFTSLNRAISAAQAANGVVLRSQTKGNPFGSRMPWTHNVDIRVQKQFQVGDKGVSVYILASNILNNSLVRRVYGYTGLAGDDGYLNSPHGQQQLESQIDAQTFATLYRIRMENPGNFGAPRMINLGAKLDF